MRTGGESRFADVLIVKFPLVEGELVPTFPKPFWLKLRHAL